MPMDREIICLNSSTKALKDEVIIDTFSASMGGYTGSFTVSRGTEKEVVKAITDTGYRKAIVRHD